MSAGNVVLFPEQFQRASVFPARRGNDKFATNSSQLNFVQLCQQDVGDMDKAINFPRKMSCHSTAARG